MGQGQPGNGAPGAPFTPNANAVEPPAGHDDGPDEDDGSGSVKLAVVVQRYGTEINGGAELLARSLAERLARFADVQVLTTCAKDYITWRNELPAGRDTVNGIAVHRFPVSRPRDTRDFGYRSRWVFEQRHSMRDELRWLDSGGPRSPALIRHIARIQNDVDFFVFVSFRYYHAFHGSRAVAKKAVLIPTAERDPAVGMAIFAPVFRGVRAVAYLTPEERALVESIAARKGPSIVAGLGSAIPDRPDAMRFRRKHNIRRPFAIYVGRIDPNKGCAELFESFRTLRRDVPVRARSRDRRIGDDAGAVASADAPPGLRIG